MWREILYLDNSSCLRMTFPGCSVTPEHDSAPTLCFCWGNQQLSLTYELKVFLEIERPPTHLIQLFLSQHSSGDFGATIWVWVGVPTIPSCAPLDQFLFVPIFLICEMQTIHSSICLKGLLEEVDPCKNLKQCLAHSKYKRKFNHYNFHCFRWAH